MIPLDLALNHRSSRDSAAINYFKTEWKNDWLWAYNSFRESKKLPDSNDAK